MKAIKKAITWENKKTRGATEMNAKRNASNWKKMGGGTH